MARNKKRAESFVELFPRSTVPAHGDARYRTALLALRDYVESNLPYGAKVVESPAGFGEDFGLRLEDKINYRLPGGVLLDGATVGRDLDLSSEGLRNIAGQVADFGETLHALKQDSMRNLRQLRSTDDPA